MTETATRSFRSIFMGSPEFAVSGLKAMVDADLRPSLVVTQPDRPRGRGRERLPTPVKEYALRKGLRVVEPEDPSEPAFVEILKAEAPTIIVVIAYGHILKRELLSIPTMGCLNIHASLLPQLRGAAPIQWAILRNLGTTGLTAMWMDEGVDTGNILDQETIGIDPAETFGTLYERLRNLSGPFLVKVLGHLKCHGFVPGRPQPKEGASYAPKITKEICRIDWRRSALEISCLVRALDPVPGAITSLRGNEIRLYGAWPKDIQMDVGPGKIIVAKGQGLIVGTGRGLIEVKELKLSGKKRLKVADFLRGFRIKEGESFE